MAVESQKYIQNY